MKHKIIFMMLCAVAAVSCSKENTGMDKVAGTGETQNVVVSLALSGDGFTTGTDYEPITRAGNEPPVIITDGRILNDYHFILLKHIDTKWIIDRIEDCKFYDLPPSYSVQSFNISNQLPANECIMELRPGTYRMLVLINAGKNVLNSEIFEGMVVRDDEDPSLIAPQATKYTILGWPYNTKEGQVALHREVFAGVHDFTVRKQEDLHSAAGQVNINITATRRVGRLHIIYRETIPETSYPIDPTISQYTDIEIDAEAGHVFCDGIDVFGDPYYSPVPRTSLSTRQTTDTGFYVGANNKNYMISTIGSTIYGSFFYTDQNIESVPYTIKYLHNSIRQGHPEYLYPHEITGMELRHNTTDILSFSATEENYYNGSKLIFLLELNDESDLGGAAFLFPPDYEWTLTN